MKGTAVRRRRAKGGSHFISGLERLSPHRLSTFFVITKNENAGQQRGVAVRHLVDVAAKTELCVT